MVYVINLDSVEINEEYIRRSNAEKYPKRVFCSIINKIKQKSYYKGDYINR